MSKSNLAFGVALGTALVAFASAAFAGRNVAPAPLMGAGLPGLAVLVAASGGYIAMRLRRRDRD
jgi:hypothetical protein